jgi:hypothetical protein
LSQQSKTIETNTTDLQTTSVCLTTVVRQTEVAALPHVCPRHQDEALTLVLRGGAGWCARCYCYVQSANHPMPVLPPELIAKREQGRLEEQRTRRNAQAKARRVATKQRGAIPAA